MRGRGGGSLGRLEGEEERKGENCMQEVHVGKRKRGWREELFSCLCLCSVNWTLHQVLLLSGEFEALGYFLLHYLDENTRSPLGLAIFFLFILFLFFGLVQNRFSISVYPPVAVSGCFCLLNGNSWSVQQCFLCVRILKLMIHLSRKWTFWKTQCFLWICCLWSWNASLALWSWCDNHCLDSHSPWNL